MAAKFERGGLVADQKRDPGRRDQVAGALEWTYRFLAAARAWADTEATLIARLTLPAAAAEPAPAQDVPEPSTAEVRAWARATGLAVPGRGKLRPEVWAAWRAAHRA